MSIEQSGVAGGAERLSALVDGEAADDDVKQACVDWRGDAKARQSWHAYQLIGDVLRSDDLASAAGRDEAFLRRLRARLADEPVVLAPQP
ncbi:MAG TPA: sigma-E factor negative regulatory protein, partial [Piscinibacter sp.]|nr:sigma-E factor negative regulatory protein [Piscinibacter sp.]